MQNRNVSHERVAIFIDGWNFAKATYEGLGIRVDFKRLLSTLAGGRTLLRAFYYIGEWTPENYAMMHDLRRVRLGLDVSEPPDPNEAERKRMQQQGFIRMLNRNGYQVVKKPVKVFADGNTKADLDIELAIDMLTLADRCERMVLVSGDSDFVPVVRAVGMRGVRIEVVGSQQPFAYDSTPERPGLPRARVRRTARRGRRVHRTRRIGRRDRTTGTAPAANVRPGRAARYRPAPSSDTSCIRR
jgi:uncharacterized LabA/DUF88 family protein